MTDGGFMEKGTGRSRREGKEVPYVTPCSEESI